MVPPILIGCLHDFLLRYALLHEVFPHLCPGNFPQSHRKGAQAKVPDYRTVGRFLDPIWSTGYVSEAVDTVTRPVTSVDVLRVSTPEPESAILSGRVVR